MIQRPIHILFIPILHIFNINQYTTLKQFDFSLLLISPNQQLKSRMNTFPLLSTVLRSCSAAAVM